MLFWFLLGLGTGAVPAAFVAFYMGYLWSWADKANAPDRKD